MTSTASTDIIQRHQGVTDSQSLKGLATGFTSPCCSYEIPATTRRGGADGGRERLSSGEGSSLGSPPSGSERQRGDRYRSGGSSRTPRSSRATPSGDDDWDENVQIQRQQLRPSQQQRNCRRHRSRSSTSKQHRCGLSSDENGNNERPELVSYCGLSPKSPAAPSPCFGGGLVRIRLSRPLGIVFQSQGRGHGVRICEIPEGGAAWRSRLLKVGDELISIDDAGMARLEFHEIMDYIVNADPNEKLDLLFRRPKVSKRRGREKDRYDIG